MRQAVLLFGGFFLLAACASTDDGAPQSRSEAPVSSSAGPVDTEAADPRALDVSSLPNGKCGMLLWMVDDGKPVMIFRAVQNEPAEMVLDDHKAQLVQVSRSGERRAGFHSEQAYTDEETGVQVNISASFGDDFRGVVTVDDGLVTIINAQGWEKVIPVAGFAGCRVA